MYLDFGEIITKLFSESNPNILELTLAIERYCIPVAGLASDLELTRDFFSITDHPVSNLFKSNLDEDEIGTTMPLFGCDAETMGKFTSRGFAGAKKIQDILFDADQVSHFQSVFNKYRSDLILKEATQTGLKITEDLKKSDPEAVK